MSLEIKENKTYPHAAADLLAAAQQAITGLEGKIKKEDPANGFVAAQIPKTIHGKVLGDRTWIEVTTVAVGDGEAELQLFAYPLNAVGQKLEFGARKGVIQTVIKWFYAHLDHNLAAK